MEARARVVEPAPSEPVSRSHEQVFLVFFFFSFSFPVFSRRMLCTRQSFPGSRLPRRHLVPSWACGLTMRRQAFARMYMVPSSHTNARTHERTSSSRSCRSLDLHVVSDHSVLIPCLSTPRLVMLFAPFLPLRPTGGGGGGEDQSPRRDTHSPKQVGALAHAWRCHCAVRRNAGLFLSAVSLHR